MLRGELIFFAVALMASVAAALVPEGGAIWTAAKAVFTVAFILFAVVLLGSQLIRRNGPAGNRNILTQRLRFGAGPHTPTVKQN